MNEMEADVQNVFNHIVGSGALSYPWWQVEAYEGISPSNDVTPNWWMDLRVDPEHGIATEAVVRINHDVLREALEKIDANARACGVAGATRDEALVLLEEDEFEADFAADMADEVLQVAVLGKVKIG